jgi:hypothetical protein
MEVVISKRTGRRDGAQAQIRARWYSKREARIARPPIPIVFKLILKLAGDAIGIESGGRRRTSEVYLFLD